VLRFEAIAHNTAELRCGPMIEKFPEIVTRLAGVTERFCSALDCVDTGFIGDGMLDELATGSTLGAIRVGGVDLNKKRMREALSAVLALAPALYSFTVGEFAAKVHADDRHVRRRLQHPPGGPRPAQTSRQTADRQAPRARAATGFQRGRRAPSLLC
jgi:hypothetical protein